MLSDKIMKYLCKQMVGGNHGAEKQAKDITEICEGHYSKVAREIEMYAKIDHIQIAQLEKEIAELKAKLASIRYLDRQEVGNIIDKWQNNKYQCIEEFINAICSLAIKINKDKVIEVLEKYLNMKVTKEYIETIANKILEVK